MNQLPLSFCSSVGYKNYMSVVEPSYKPCHEGAMKKRLAILQTTVKEKMKENLGAIKSIVFRLTVGLRYHGNRTLQ